MCAHSESHTKACFNCASAILIWTTLADTDELSDISTSLLSFSLFLFAGKLRTDPKHVELVSLCIIQVFPEVWQHEISHLLPLFLPPLPWLGATCAHWWPIVPRLPLSWQTKRLRLSVCRQQECKQSWWFLTVPFRPKIIYSSGFFPLFFTKPPMHKKSCPSTFRFNILFRGHLRNIWKLSFNGKYFLYLFAVTQTDDPECLWQSVTEDELIFITNCSSCLFSKSEISPVVLWRWMMPSVLDYSWHPGCYSTFYHFLSYVNPLPWKKW